MTKVLFICTGNICRSPMAEGLFRDMMKGAPVEARSAGIGAFGGQPPSRHAVEVMRELGVDISKLRSKPVTQQMVREADFILAMTYGHLDTLLMLYPQAADKTFLLRDFQKDLGAHEREIDDPIGQAEHIYRRCRDQIRDALISFADTLKKKWAEKPASSAPPEALPAVVIAADHGGVELKEELVEHLRAAGYPLEDLGAFSTGSVDYPDYAAAASRAVLAGRAQRGILICRSGIGMSMAANKFPGIRAALVATPQNARLSREHNDANVVCLSAQELDFSLAAEIVEAFLHAGFSGGRHETRVRKLEALRQDANFMNMPPSSLAVNDPEIYAAIQSERKRQHENIELIASENFTSSAVMEAQGSCLTNKYAEGYPAKRWYGGCEHVDVVELLAIERAKKLFGAEHVNVQPHSGSQANMACYFSVLQPGDRMLTMDLSHGGHLTHGHKMNFSGKLFEIMHYGVSEKAETIDYDVLAEKAESFKPKMITVGASAYSRVIDFKRMREIADSVGALLLADIAHIAGLVAAGEHPSPVPYADFVTTTTHKTLRGPRSGLILCKEKFAKDLDSNVFPGMQGGPLMHVIAAKAVCLLEAQRPEFKTYQQQVRRNAKALCEGMKKNGYRIVSGDTENHVFLVDVQPQGLNGKEVQETLDHAGITVNKNSIPFDKQSPFKGGGIRIGSPAVTSRQMKEPEMAKITGWIREAIENRADAAKLKAIGEEVHAFASKFPLP
jgi:RpiB/LacA/LacB family sugar-phosphate isomerase